MIHNNNFPRNFIIPTSPTQKYKHPLGKEGHFSLRLCRIEIVKGAHAGTSKRHRRDPVQMEIMKRNAEKTGSTQPGSLWLERKLRGCEIEA